jgi:type IV secretory pathway VirB2 component (pilin)
MRQLLVRLAADIDYTTLPNTGATGDVAKDSIPEILRIVFGISGSIALLIIVISGLRYILASGDPARMAQAKKGILYAVLGLVIALSGYSIVTFVVRGVG